MLAVDPQQPLDELLAIAEDRLQVPRLLSTAARSQPQPHAGRRFARATFPRRAVLELGQSLPSLPRCHGYFVILTRDLSRSGIGFLHAGELYPGEQVRLWLPTGALTAEVARCQRHALRCFEVGARFSRSETR